MTASETNFPSGLPCLTEVEDDRRSEPRVKTSGEVRLSICGTQKLEIPGRVLDLSAHGMRAEHMYPALTPGMMLEVQYGPQQYSARVVWNRIKEDGVETGFYLF